MRHAIAFRLASRLLHLFFCCLCVQEMSLVLRAQRLLEKNLGNNNEANGLELSLLDRLLIGLAILQGKANVGFGAQDKILKRRKLLAQRVQAWLPDDPLRARHEAIKSFVSETMKMLRSLSRKAYVKRITIGRICNVTYAQSASAAAKRAASFVAPK